MAIEVQLTDLYGLHPLLAWDELIGATALVMREKKIAPFRCDIEIVDVPLFDGDGLQLVIHADGINVGQLAKRKRTIERPRLIENAAIALAGLVIYHACGFEIKDVAFRGSGGDFLVGDAYHLLEVTGRSRRGDFESAWRQHWDRLREAAGAGFFLFAVEFQTPRARLAFLA
jgi:hypothetical protein